MRCYVRMYVNKLYNIGGITVHYLYLPLSVGGRAEALGPT